MVNRAKKRSRKFLAKGGPQGMIAKGTITKKGKMRNRRDGKTSKEKGDGEKDRRKEEEKRAETTMKELADKERDENDFCNATRLGELDMDSFFNEMMNDVDDDGDDVATEKKNEKNEGSDNGSDDDDNGEDEDDDGASSSSDSDSDWDDDDEEAIKRAEERMKAEMLQLESKDPEFHDFLEQNERSLLEFGKNDDVTMDDGEDDSDDDDENTKGKKTKKLKSSQDDTDTKDETSKSKEPTKLSLRILANYERSTFELHSVKSLRRIVTAYSVACHMAGNDGLDNGGRTSMFEIDESEVFDRLMVVALSRCYEEFYYHLVGEGAAVATAADSSGDGESPKKKRKKKKMKDDDKGESMKDVSENSEKDTDSAAAPKTALDDYDPQTPLDPRHLSKSPRFTSISKTLDTFIRSTNHLLQTSSQPQLIRTLLKHLVKYIPFFSLFPQHATRLLKLLTSKHWITPTTSETNVTISRSIQLRSFLIIRQLGLTQPYPFLESCLKSTYLSFAKTCKFNSEAALPTLIFRGNCLVELYSLDAASSYQHAFVYIRQLALLLRRALQTKSKESVGAVYSWQYLHCLRVWSAILASNAGNELRGLSYPLVEVILGVVKLLPSPRYVPLRLHCVRMLQQLAAAGETFIPTGYLLLDVLELPPVHDVVKGQGGGKKKKGKGKGSVRGIRLPLILKLPKEDTLRTGDQLDAVISEVFVLLGREVDLYRYSPAFVEYGMRIAARLRKFAKLTRDSRWRAYARGCIETIEKQSSQCLKARGEISEAPKDVSRLEFLKPEGEPNMKERYDKSIEQEKGLLERTTPKVSTKKVKTDKVEESDNMDVEVADEKEESLLPEKKEISLDDLPEDDEVVEGADWSSSSEDEE